jgi:two-component system chemotaxis response regulator CheB
MPLSAINEVQIDYQVDASDMGPLIATLIDEHKERRVDSDDPALRERIGAEVAIAKEGGAFRKAIMNIGQLTPFTCPECHGALVMLQEGQMNRYRCHTGHAFSESALLDGVMETTEDMLWQTLRSMEEAVMVLQHMARHLEEAGATSHAGSYYAKAKEIEARSRAFQEVVLKQEGRRAHERLVGE